ncbi:beta-1,4-N-acetylgalactosaminyltransferase bre-4-like [Palaemon carinicauda]|uniref:beta-1,4-N-acetylgalactosaminyltransferase bre-4-like n=1 Tax=Palaemon carinicauda TaxID=392227 RepID=UPI0035B6967C
MYAPVSDDGVSTCGSWFLRLFRPRFWKFLLILIMLMFIIHISYNILHFKVFVNFKFRSDIQSTEQSVNKSLSSKTKTNEMSVNPVNNNNNNTATGKALTEGLLNKEKKRCPPVPPNLVGTVKVNLTVPPLAEQEKNHPELEPGGRYRPPSCLARHRVAIIIPYRNRSEHLPVFFNHIHQILQKQQLDYSIYIVEQSANGKFNRAMLMNVGALEALKLYEYDCFIFHDLDLLPEDDRNLYTCPEQPRHMSVAVDTLNYRLPYQNIFGGVCALTVDQFEAVNGFSNKFWGWGGEDDDMFNRIKFHGFFVTRYPTDIARYKMLSHKKDTPNPHRFQNIYDGKKRFKTDGLNSAKYKVLDVQLSRLYTRVHVDLLSS